MFALGALLGVRMRLLTVLAAKTGVLGLKEVKTGLLTVLMLLGVKTGI